MFDRADLFASCSLTFFVAGASLSHVLRPPRTVVDDTRHTALPESLRAITFEVLTPLSRALAAAGVSANAVTAFSLASGAVAGVLLALGHFGLAAVAIAAASLGDAVDGLVARHTGTASAGGALFDASVDRYEEGFLLGGLAILFRTNVALLAVTLFALVGSFMVSYGSAKAEGFGVPVPKGILRRPERAVLLATGVTFVPIASAIVHARSLPSWIGVAPIVIALTVVAVAGNVSAVARLRAIARAASREEEIVAHAPERVVLPLTARDRTP